MFHIKKGLTIPITGTEPTHLKLCDTLLPTTQVAVLGMDYNGLKPKILVNEGTKVKIGTPLLMDKSNSGVHIVSPNSGTVVEVNRGPKRILQSIVIQSEEKQQHQSFKSFQAKPIDQLNKDDIRALLLESGQWVSFLTRPYSRIPDSDSTPNSIFVTATDTNPLATDPKLIIEKHQETFLTGLNVLSKLSPKIYLCTDNKINFPSLPNKVEHHVFSGKHPSGLAGTHIHFLDPVRVEGKTVWTIKYQEVIALGHLFLTGQLWHERYVTLNGPNINNPRIVKTYLGASLKELLSQDAPPLTDTEKLRIISGSILNGHTANHESLAYLGRYHSQITVLIEGYERPMFHYLTLGLNRFSKIPTYLSFLNKRRLWNFSTSCNGSERAMVPIGIYEEVLPLDILATPLLRSLIVGDKESSKQLGCLELDEEDLALCTYVCPSKYDYGSILRENLDRIRLES